MATMKKEEKKEPRVVLLHTHTHMCVCVCVCGNTN